MNTDKKCTPNLLVRFSTIFLILFFAYPAIAETIMGTIYRADTHEPLPLATVLIEINNNLAGAQSDMRGAYIIKDVPPGEYSLKAHLIGLVDRTIENVIVKENQTTSIDIELELQKIDMESIVFVPNPEIQNCDFENDLDNIHKDQRILFEVLYIIITVRPLGLG